MKYGNLLELLGEFDPRWKSRFEQLMDNSSRLAIDTVTNNRHQIAHGRWTNRTIAVTKSDYDRIKGAIETLAAILDPVSTG